MAILRRLSSPFPRQWNPTQAPAFPVEVDTTHPLARGLGSLFLLNGNVIDIAGGTPPASLLSSPSFVPTARGPLLNCPGAGYVSVPDAPIFAVGSAGFSIVALLSIVSWGGYNGIACKTAGGSGPWQYWTNQSTGQPVFNAGAVATNPVPTSGIHAVAVTVSGNSNPIVAHYLDGAANGSGTWSGTIGTSADPVLLGRRADGAVQLNGNIGAVGFYSRAVGASEAAWLAAEPFAMLRPVVRRQYYAASAPSGNLTGTAAAASTASGVLTGVGALTGTAASASAITATLTGKGALSGTAAAASTASGTLSGTGTLTGTAAGASTATATLTGKGALVGTSAAASATTGTLSGVGAITGTAVTASSATGTLTGTGALVSTSAAASTATGILTAAGSGALTGTAAAVSTATGTLTGAGALTGAAVAAAAATGTLTGFGRITGVAEAISSATGILTNAGSGNLVGTAVATSTATGILTARPVPPPPRQRTIISAIGSRTVTSPRASRTIGS